MRTLVGFIAILAVMLGYATPSVQAQDFAPSPGPFSDGTSIDQGIAYMLMLVALLLTYLIHPLDSSSSSYFF
ncbi:arabinogalactan protein 20-like [Primulina eburnea]|uniref:arabinogalactan protein 20-like n=1 Tax=Primulina eburnea TaxID=1245227 RepID=UPI003C6C89BB